jgi:hypothetical protein
MLMFMAKTVLGGAVTSVGASVVLIFCMLTFCRVYGTFIMTAVGMSCVYALLLFPSLVMTFGPQWPEGHAKSRSASLDDGTETSQPTPMVAIAEP